jgi:hypothetical protein
MDDHVTMADGSAVTDDHRDIDPATGMQKGYVVLSAEERAKGFVRPVRLTYRHVGAPAPSNLRDLTDSEHKRYAGRGYVKFERYGADHAPLAGKYWTQAELSRVNTPGCGILTKMAQSIAETFARNPTFYSDTHCARCRRRFPVGEYGEFVWEGTDDRVGT